MVNTTYLLGDIRDNTKQRIIDVATYLGVGTGTATASDTDTALDNEVLRKARQEYTNNTNNVIISLWLGTSEANGNDLAEVGCFDASSGGNLLSRDNFTALSKTNDMEVWFDIEEDVDVSQ